MDNKWIPVEERLPDEGGDYLVSVRTTSYTTSTCVSNSITYISIFWWDSIERRWEDEQHPLVFGDQVIAWMPLPEPF